MEFKGTQGEWDFDKNCVFTKEIINGNVICESPSWSEDSNKNWSYNAQLISKAPEMLEFIISLLNESDDIVHDEIKKEAKKLIEEETKID